MVPEEVTHNIKQIINDELLIIREATPPKYLLSFMNESDILYVYKQKEVIDDPLAIQLKAPFSDETLEELDLTGQPLECPFSMDDSTQSDKLFTEKREEDDHCPLVLKEAKDIITFVNLNAKLNIPLYILTDGFDKNHTILLGSARKDGWFTRSWVTLEDFSRDANRITNVVDMIQNHHKLSLINPINTNSEVTGKYIIESMSGCHTTFLKDSPGRLEVNLSWKTPTFTVPLNETSVKITVESSITNDISEISDLWNQLTLLYDYLAIIKTWKTDRQSQGPYSRHSVDFPNLKQLQGEVNQVKPIKDILTQLLLEPNKITGATLTERNANFEKRTLEDIVSTITNEKKEQEFTDRLWNLLIESSSYQEIRSCFEIVFQYVRNGSSKPYMKTTNITRLSHVLRCCKSDSSHSEMILEPLELLVEIGIEKLKKEYISVYLLAKIASSEQLSIPSLPKFPEVKADDWIDHCSKWIMWLTRVHIVLQLMLVTESIMKSKVCIIPLTTLTLEHYLGQESPIDKLINPRDITSQIFTTAVNTRDVLDLLNRKTPFNSWTLTLRSTIPNREVVSIYHRNIDEIFPSSISLANELCAEENATFTSNIFSYHCYDYHSVSDLLC